MDFERMKSDWDAASRNLNAGAQDTMAGSDSRRKTLLDRLARRYRIFIIISCVSMTVFGPMWSSLIHRGLNPGSAIGMTVATVAFFGICATVDSVLYWRIKSIDCATMTVDEVLRRSMSCRKMHLLSILCLLPLAVAMLSYIALCFGTDIYFICGMIAGAAIGLIIGLNELKKFMDDYKNLK